MHLKTFVLAALAFACGSPIYTQAQSMHLSDFSVYLGGNTSGDYGTLQDFQLLAPNSNLLQNDFTGYNNSSGYNSWNSSARISFMLGFDFKKKDDDVSKLSPQLRIGLTYTNGVSLYSNYWNEDRFAYDTLTSSRTGNQTFVDSVNYDSYDMNYHSDNIVLDVSLIFRTNPAARWSFYGGVGVMGGMAINANTIIYHYNNSYIENQNDDQYFERQYSDSSLDEMETVRNDNSFLVSGYIPMGVDFRLGKKRELWKRTHLFFELRPSLNVNNIPEVGTFTQGSVHHGFGIRIT
ncbi:hypothetical protein Oweho_0808 [Owenweeksia hongkongensis DSM 17368]|uniref:Outer membrane protein beta-barrel domain-containing protein n=1 Tax=Owenweeksia hongkongensis (strain DSM 17368 / CIP 108786 / JCM 12287 / NRRL B-23963 / UST20020801) TaxID=926562 RepID=G8R271_OWEHD|nr:hypothetical protein [Owenweeksia hongkongensis]AEV31821.1 hypothetical protein Oweho_0808 [Owenweeksia hongkongensis DSM 17368]